MLNKMRPTLRLSQAMAFNFKNHRHPAHFQVHQTALVHQQMRTYGIFDRFFSKKEEEQKTQPKELNVEDEASQEDTATTIEVESEQQEVNEEVEEVESQLEEAEEAEEIVAQAVAQPEEVETEIEKVDSTKLFGKSTKLEGKVQSKLDKLDDITILEDGSVRHNVLKQLEPKKGKGNEKVKVKTNKARTWKSLQVFRKWRASILSDRQTHLRDSLSPLQYYVTQGMGWERPFTGDFWWTKDTGMYSCAVCT